MTKRTSQAFVAKVVKLKGAAECGLTSRETNNGIFLHLSEGWALSHDRHQWMVMCWRGRTKGWRPVSFVASNKGVLMRIIRERGITPTSEANAALDRLANSFKSWRNSARGIQDNPLRAIEIRHSGQSRNEVPVLY